ncbi:hypothetical protein FGO68_gene5662 [Halteria grandinella]|uniref:Uncharacterized protein n=1 Tax=Halteria grandinella TaxID=5974 RepID=A0A8J8NT71_HALGN|nr:hypothetical protein FGO68_gene5662 [Halteria grandinella]
MQINKDINDKINALALESKMDFEEAPSSSQRNVNVCFTCKLDKNCTYSVKIKFCHDIPSYSIVETNFAHSHALPLKELAEHQVIRQIPDQNATLMEHLARDIDLLFRCHNGRDDSTSIASLETQVPQFQLVAPSLLLDYQQQQLFQTVQQPLQQDPIRKSLILSPNLPIKLENPDCTSKSISSSDKPPSYPDHQYYQYRQAVHPFAKEVRRLRDIKRDCKQQLGLINRGRGKIDCVEHWSAVLADCKMRGDGEKIRVAQLLVDTEAQLNEYEKQGANVGRYRRYKKRRRNKNKGSMLMVDDQDSDVDAKDFDKADNEELVKKIIKKEGSLMV